MPYLLLNNTQEKHISLKLSTKCIILNICDLRKQQKVQIERFSSNNFGTKMFASDKIDRNLRIQYFNILAKFGHDINAIKPDIVCLLQDINGMEGQLTPVCISLNSCNVVAMKR